MIRHTRGFHISVLRGLGAFLMTLCVFAGFRGNVLASDGAAYTVTILSEDATRISYAISSPVIGKQLVAVTATYRNGQMQQFYIDNFTSEETVHTGNMTVSAEFDDFKVMLLDGNTYSPLCSYGGYMTVRFLDEDGALLSEQRILSGHAAQRPDVQEKAGFLFGGWDGEGDFTAVFQDMTFSPRYVADDSANIFSVTSAEAAPGDEVTVRLQLLGTVELCGFDLRLHYNGDALEYVSMDSELDFEVTANHVASGNYIRLNFSSRVNKTQSGGIIEVTFRVKDAGITDAIVDVQPVSVIAVDPEDGGRLMDVEHTICEGVIRIA